MNFEGVSLKKSFWRFVWPSVLAQWIFALYTMVDGMFVARGVSEVALSAVNIASPFVNFLFSVSILFAVGTSTIVAIFLGQGKHREANQANTQNLAVSGLIALMIMAAVWLCLDPLVMFLGATESTVGYVRQYILSILPFTWFFISSYTFETLVKTDGYPRFAAIAVTTGALTNCVLDYLFVMVFLWGIGGAGYFTAIERPKESLVISLGRGMVIMAGALSGCIALAGGRGIWWAPTVSETVCLGITLILVCRHIRRETAMTGAPCGAAAPVMEES